MSFFPLCLKCNLIPKFHLLNYPISSMNIHCKCGINDTMTISEYLSKAYQINLNLNKIPNFCMCEKYST